MLRRFWLSSPQKRAILSPVKGTPPGERDTRAAISELSQAVRNDPDAVEIYLALGNLYRAQGDFERAVQIRSNLIVRPGLDDKFKARAYFELGNDYKRGGFMDRAMQAFEQARRLGGDSQEIIRSMAMLYAESGNFEQAAAMYGKRKHPVGQAHYMVRNAEEVYRSGKESEAKKLLSKALKVYSGSVEAWTAKLSLAVRDEEWRKVKSLLTDALPSVVPSTRFLLLEGLVDPRFGLPANKLQQLDNKHTPAVLATKGNSPLDEKLCSIVIPAIEAQDPDLILQYYGALFLLRAGEQDEANAWLAKTMVLRPDFWAARLELLGQAMDEQPLSPVFKNQLEFFVQQAKKVKRFVCGNCGMRREQTFYVCPKCRSWHSVAFRLNLQD